MCNYALLVEITSMNAFDMAFDGRLSAGRK
jgi:hypothetical protein